MGEKRGSSQDLLRRWGPATKRGVFWALFILLALLVYQFRAVVPQLVLAGVMAFILEPVVRLLQRRLRMTRAAATAVVFVFMVLIGLGVLAAPVTAVPAVQRGIRSLQLDFDRIVGEIGKFLDRPLDIGGYSLDLSEFYGQLSEMLSRFATSVAEGTLDIVIGIASGAVQLVFIFIAAFYLVKDTEGLIDSIDRLAPPGLENDFVRLRKQITAAWSAFLRSQLLLIVIVAVIVAIACTALGLPYPVALGLLAGLLEIVPHIGPTLAAVPAILLALFVGSSYLPLSHFWTAVLTVGVYGVIQQIENNFLVPRIMARGLDLHPLPVLIAIVVGGNVAGILGIVLAPPALATLRVLWRYVSARLYDRDPWAVRESPTAVEDTRRPRGALLERAWEWLREGARQQIPGFDAEADDEADHTDAPDESQQTEG